jgi:hypothetical protein
VQPVSAPEEALNQLMECLLLSFRYSPEQRTFTLATDYPLKSPGSIRQFVGFTFTDADFTREYGEIDHFRQYDTSFQAGPQTGAIVVQSVTQSTTNTGSRRLDLWFGPNFGGVHIRYGRVVGYTRGSTAEQVNPTTWVYRDLQTRQEFDMFKPFPSLVG